VQRGSKFISQCIKTSKYPPFILVACAILTNVICGQEQYPWMHINANKLFAADFPVEK